MTIATKRRIVLVGFAVVAIWPLVHHVIVRSLDMSPWKGFGWSMYCVPPRVTNTYLYSLDDGRSLRLGEVTPPQQQALRRAADEFGKWRAEFGALVKPDAFGRVALDCYPNEQRIELVVEDIGVVRSSATFERQRVDHYEYRRSELQP